MFKDLIQTIGLPITSFTVSGDIKKNENIKKKKSSENDQLTVHFQSFFIYFFRSPDPKSEKKKSHKSTNKKNSGLNCEEKNLEWYNEFLIRFNQLQQILF